MSSIIGRDCPVVPCCVNAAFTVIDINVNIDITSNSCHKGNVAYSLGNGRKRG